VKKLLLIGLLVSCSFVQSFRDATIENYAKDNYRITAHVAGLLTVASDAQITSLRGVDVSSCSVQQIEFGYGVLCRRVVSGFQIEITSVAKSVTARVTR
jgi:hypothetical protein